MTPAELRTACLVIYGAGWNGRGWIHHLAADLDRDCSTVWRWANGKLPIPKYVSLFLESKQKTGT